MPKSGKKLTKPASAKRKAPASPAKAAAGAAAREAEAAAAEHYIRGVITRGEAVEAEPGAPLPAGVTHRLVDRGEGKLPSVVRERFSAF